MPPRPERLTQGLGASFIGLLIAVAGVLLPWYSMSIPYYGSVNIPVEFKLTGIRALGIEVGWDYVVTSSGYSPAVLGIADAHRHTFYLMAIALILSMAGLALGIAARYGWQRPKLAGILLLTASLMVILSPLVYAAALSSAANQGATLLGGSSTTTFCGTGSFFGGTTSIPYGSTVLTGSCSPGSGWVAEFVAGPLLLIAAIVVMRAPVVPAWRRPSPMMASPASSDLPQVYVYYPQTGQTPAAPSPVPVQVVHAPFAGPPGGAPAVMPAHSFQVVRCANCGASIVASAIRCGFCGAPRI
jgi:hypothetical protein